MGTLSDDFKKYQRPRIDEPDVVEVLLRLGVDAETAEDLGGTTSLNVHLPRSGEVLRIHARFTSRSRVEALRELRRHLGDRGLLVGTPTRMEGRDVTAVGPYLAELEVYVDHVKPPAEWASYLWMYSAMGRLHRMLADRTAALPRPVMATYGPPGSLRRWLRVTERAVESDPRSQEIPKWVRQLIGLLERQWVPAKSLPCRVVHGDIRLGNLAVGARGAEDVYLDFGFAAVRPRVHDLAYSLPWIVLRPDGTGRAEHFDWATVAELVGAYEDSAKDQLSHIERHALAGYIAAVPLYMAAIAGFTQKPAEMLRGDIAFFEIAEWALTNPLPNLTPSRRA